MKIPVPFVACFTLFFVCGITSGQEYYGNQGKIPIDTLRRLMRSSGVFTYKIQKYIIEMDKNLPMFANRLLGRQGPLDELNPKIIQDVLRDVDKLLGNLTIFKIDISASSPNLFTNDKARWKLEVKTDGGGVEEVEISPGKSRNIETEAPVLISVKEGSRFELNLGPKFSKALKIRLIYFDENNQQQSGEFLLSDPTLDISLKKSVDSIQYSIFAHRAEIHGVSAVPKTKKKKYELAKVFRFVRKLTETVLKNIEELNPLNDGPTYRYYSKTTTVGFQNDNIEHFIRQWIEPVSDSHVKVNLYGAISHFLQDPSILTVKETETHRRLTRREAELSHGKDMVSTNKFIGQKSRTNFKPSNEADNFIVNAVKSRASEMVKKAEEKLIPQQELPQLQEWIVKKMKRDFQKHRKLNGLNYKFVEVDRNIKEEEKEKIEPYYRKLGFNYGDEKPYYDVYEEDCEDEGYSPEKPYYDAYEEDCEEEDYSPEKPYYDVYEEDCEDEDYSPEKP